ncbi:unnamed protein product [Candida parapsilosis]
MFITHNCLYQFNIIKRTRIESGSNSSAKQISIDASSAVIGVIATSPPSPPDPVAAVAPLAIALPVLLPLPHHQDHCSLNHEEHYGYAYPITNPH